MKHTKPAHSLDNLIRLTLIVLLLILIFKNRTIGLFEFIAIVLVVGLVAVMFKNRNKK